MTCRQVRKRLGAYLDAELEPPQAEEVRAHLAWCGACQGELAATARVIALVVEAAEEVTLQESLTPATLRAIAARRAERERHRPRVVRLAWAGGLAVLLLLGLSVWFLGLRGERQPTSVPTSQNAQAQVTQAAPVPRATPESSSSLSPPGGERRRQQRRGGHTTPSPVRRSVPGRPHQPWRRAPDRPILAHCEGPDLEVRPSDQRMWQPAAAHTALRAGDLVRTPPGKIGELTLYDGSRVKLNSGSVLEVRWGGLALFRGEVWVSAQPQVRPLHIRTPNGVEAEVVGTEFDVFFDRLRGETTLTVVVGTVRLRASRQATTVHAGQQAVARATAVTDPQAVDVGRVVAWATGALPAPEVWYADFAVTADRATNVFPLTEQPCTFTLRLRNRSREVRTLEVAVHLVDRWGHPIQEMRQIVVAPADSLLQTPLAVPVEQPGLYTVFVTVQSDDTILKTAVDFAVEEEKPEAPGG